MRGLVHDDEVKLAVAYLFLDDLDTIEVDDHELGTAVDDLLALLGVAVGYVHCSVHRHLKQVSAPCGVHDRQRADDERPTHLALLHQEVCGPDGRCGFACALLVEAE